MPLPTLCLCLMSRPVQLRDPLACTLKNCSNAHPLETDVPLDLIHHPQHRMNSCLGHLKGEILMQKKRSDSGSGMYLWTG